MFGSPIGMKVLLKAELPKEYYNLFCYLSVLWRAQKHEWTAMELDVFKNDVSCVLRRYAQFIKLLYISI